MIIKLTNAAKEFKGQPILINTDHIISIFQDTLEVDSKTKEIVSTVYSITQQSWVVTETVDKIFKITQDRILV